MSSLTEAHTGERIVVVEDEIHLAQGILDNLEAEGYRTEGLGDARMLEETLTREPAALIILDVMLPGLDGITACRDLRARGDVTPVLFLTAKNAPEERVAGLGAGGDDYLGKPFVLDELLGRVAALLRRTRWQDVAHKTQALGVMLGDTYFDFRRFEVTGPDGHTDELPPREAQILKLLVARRGEVVSREDILEKVWGLDVLPSSRTVDNFIVRLRRRFEPDPQEPRWLSTVRGVGYRLAPDEEV